MSGVVKGDRVRVTLSPWITKQKGLLTREFEGEAKAVTAKAILLSGHASLRASSHCLRCGKVIEHPISLLVGYGPWCSEQLGIPRPEKLTPEVIAEVKERIAKETHLEVWFPFSQCRVEKITETAKTDSNMPWGADF